MALAAPVVPAAPAAPLAPAAPDALGAPVALARRRWRLRGACGACGAPVAPAAPDACGACALVAPRAPRVAPAAPESPPAARVVPVALAWRLRRLSGACRAWPRGIQILVLRKIDACAFLPNFCERKWEDPRLRASLNRGVHNERPPKLLFSGLHFSIHFRSLCIRP